MTLREGIEKLAAEGRKLDRAELVVAWYELVGGNLDVIADALSRKSSQIAFGLVQRDLLRCLPLPSDEPDLLEVPGFFWKALTDWLASYPPEILAKSTLWALDSSFHLTAEMRLERVGPWLVEESFFHRKPFWVVPRSPGKQPPWWQGTRPGELPPGAHVTGLSPVLLMHYVRILPRALAWSGAFIRLGDLESGVDRYFPSGGSAEPVERPLRIAISSLSRSIRAASETRAETVTFAGRTFPIYRFTGQEDLESLGDSFRDEVLPACQADDVAVLLLPELTVSPELRRRFSDILREEDRRRRREVQERSPRPVLVVAGSFHEIIEGRSVNRSVVLDYRGESPLLVSSRKEEERHWEHDKVAAFILDEKEPSAGESSDVHRLEVGAEPEQLGRCFTVVSSRIGSVCLAICIDYLKFGRQFSDPLQGAWVDWLWVPAASLKVGRFEEIARDLAVSGAGTVVVNACWLSERFQPKVHPWTGLAHLPGDLARWRGLPAGVMSRHVPAGSSCGAGACPRENGEKACLFVLDVPLSP